MLHTVPWSTLLSPQSPPTHKHTSYEDIVFGSGQNKGVPDEGFTLLDKIDMTTLDDKEKDITKVRNLNLSSVEFFNNSMEVLG